MMDSAPPHSLTGWLLIQDHGGDRSSINSTIDGPIASKWFRSCWSMQRHHTCHDANWTLMAFGG